MNNLRLNQVFGSSEGAGTAILTFLGFGLLSRTLLVSQIAGAERWTAKAFYAADSGINVAKARLNYRSGPAVISFFYLLRFNENDFTDPEVTSGLETLITLN